MNMLTYADIIFSIALGIAGALFLFFAL